MRLSSRKLLTASLAALYSGIALLGYGLHELAPAHHHHHATAHSHSHAGCTGHSHRHAPIPVTPGFSDSHECDICGFLDQIQSDRPLLVTPIAWQPLVADVAISTPQNLSQPILGLAAPRGPPALVG